MNARELERLGWRGGGSQVAMPGRDEIHLWLVRVPAAGDPLEPLLARLTAAERTRATHKRMADKRAEYITGQAALRTLLAAALARDPCSIHYRRGVKGKPYLDLAGDDRGLQFNLTHSGGVVAVALARGREVGVDVEWHNERTDPERVARRVCTPHERATLAALPPAARRRQFFRLWTCKEALVKCTGMGIHSGMSCYQIALEGPDAARVSGAWGRQAGVERLQVAPLPLGDGHAGALVYEPPSARLHYWLLDGAPDPLKAVARG